MVMKFNVLPKNLNFKIFLFLIALYLLELNLFVIFLTDLNIIHYLNSH